jgi:hypothetical protein
MTEPIRSLADPEQTRNRAEILNQFFRGMLALNGGGCRPSGVLQAIWNSVTPAFTRLVVIGLVFFIVGLTLTAGGQFMRYKNVPRVAVWQAKRSVVAAHLLLVCVAVGTRFYRRRWCGCLGPVFVRWTEGLSPTGNARAQDRAPASTQSDRHPGKRNRQILNNRKGEPACLLHGRLLGRGPNGIITCCVEELVAGPS